MSYGWSAIVFSLGLFALVAQALLFRSFLTAFEGNELGVGSFFGSWLIWVALGALLGRIATRVGRIERSHFALLTLLYVPAFVLQDLLIANSRTIAGVASYEVFPLHIMAGLSLVANAPVSLLTGLLFTLACRCAARDRALPVARIYILESLGGFAGGIAVTLLLSAGLRGETVSLCASLALALAVALFFVRQKETTPLFRSLGMGPPVVLLALLVSGADERWAATTNRATWKRLLPVGAYRGSFTTAQGKYLYGERQGQFIVMSWGGVSETLPNAAHASEVAALTLAQNPAASKVLVVGPGSLSICLAFAKLPQTKKVSWLHPDPEYPRALWEVLPEGYWPVRAPLEVSELDVRTFVEQSPPGEYDLILLDLPDVTTLVLNRYSTLEFFRLIKRVLASEGVVALRVSGGENYLGGELAYLGSSALRTLEAAFSQVKLKPGDESWFIASDGEELREEPAVLRDRFASIKNSEALYPPDGIMSLWPADRIELQMGRYREAAERASPEILLNTDQHPKALLYSLAVALRRATGKAVSGDLQVLLAGGIWICASAIVLYAILRLVYLLAAPRIVLPVGRTALLGQRLFDARFLVFSTGLAGMSLSIVLMFLYQSRYGALYLHVGLVSSLFMLGLFLGSLLLERVLEQRAREPRWLLPGLIATLLAIALLVLLLPVDAPQVQYAFLFVLCGLVTGTCFPLGAYRMKAAGKDPAVAGSSLELIDHLGGAAGAVLTALFLLPLFGTPATIALLALLVAVNLFPSLLAYRREASVAVWEDRLGPLNFRPAGYALFGTVAFFLVVSNIVTAVEVGQESRRLEAAARLLSSSDEPREEVAELEGEPLAYYVVEGTSGGAASYIFSTRQLAGEITGYGGPITLALHVDHTGLLRGFHVLASRETPAYLARLESWNKRLLGRNTFSAGAFADVDAVTGATMTSNAILEILDHSGRAFASRILHMDVARPPPATRTWRPDRNFLFLTLLMGIAIALRYFPHPWLRRLFLAASFTVAGLWLNLQYSTQQVMSLASLELPAFALTGGFFLVVLVPVVVILFGNVYCGYVCPFGALQELVGDLRPRRHDTDPGKPVWRYGRLTKYLLLALLLALFALSHDYTVLSADPLITVFGQLGGSLVFWMGAAGLALSLVFRRFWCRNLCPAGAFLALLNRLRLLRRLLPRTAPGRCDLGVRNALELDCLYCDRCRHEKN